MSGLERHLNPYPPETHTTQGEPSHRRHRDGDRHGGTIRGTSVGLPITANDRNGHALTYTLPGQDPDHSVVQEPGQVDTRHPLNYEARNTYTVRVLTVTAGAKPKWTFGSLTRTSPRIRQTAPPPQPHQQPCSWITPVLREPHQPGATISGTAQPGKNGRPSTAC